jgi:hypothetical protein
MTTTLAYCNIELDTTVKEVYEADNDAICIYLLSSRLGFTLITTIWIL